MLEGKVITLGKPGQEYSVDLHQADIAFQGITNADPDNQYGLHLSDVMMVAMIVADNPEIEALVSQRFAEMNGQ